MPVWKPTADCIWNSFRNSHKRHLILTGKRGVGKTTLLKTLFGWELPGITTFAEPKKAVCLKKNQTGECVRIGVYREDLPGVEKKMERIPGILEGYGIPWIEECTKGEGQWVSIDEIGYLETDCEGYLDAIRNLMEKKRVAAVVRKQKLPFLQEICSREDVFLVDLDQPFGKYACVIMASGLGKRFGENKLLADFLGKPLLCRILEATEGMFFRRVVVTRYKEAAALCREMGAEVILHDLPDRNDTIRLGLSAVNDAEGWLFCPGDQPLLRKETIASLLLSAVNDGDSIWRPAFGETPGAPVLFPRWAFSELESLPKGKGGGKILEAYPDRVRWMGILDPLELMDVDTPEELKELKGQFLMKKIH
jgi:molybdenum cofactor cytidylyltransferase